jgi:putative transposase
MTMREDPAKPAKRKTCRRYNDVGHAHSLTFSCFKRQPLLSKDRTRQWLLQALDDARRALHFDLWAYVIMPEHCHVLLWPGEERYSTSQILYAIKMPVARNAIDWLKANAPERMEMLLDEQPNGKALYRFWQRGGGYDRNLVEPATIHATIEYIHNNPVRRGLVQHAEDWPWSSAGFYAGEEDAKLQMDPSSLPR